MDRVVRNRSDMAVRVRDFCRAHPSADGNFASVLGQLEEKVTSLESLSQQQQRGYLGRHSAAVRRRELRHRVREELLRHLVTVADAAAVEQPALKERFRLPSANGTNAVLLARARELLDEGRAAREVLLRHGLSERLLDDLAAALEEFAASVSASNEARRDHVGARAELRAVSDEVMRLVALLDGLVRYRFSGDAQTLAAWASARKVVAGPQAAAPQPPAPPAGGGKEVKPAA